MGKETQTAKGYLEELPIPVLDPALPYLCVYFSICSAVCQALDLNFSQVTQLTPRSFRRKREEVSRILSDKTSRQEIPWEWTDAGLEYLDLLHPKKRYKGPIFSDLTVLNLSSFPLDQREKDLGLDLVFADELLRELYNGLSVAKRDKEAFLVKAAREGMTMVPIKGIADVKKFILDGYHLLVGITRANAMAHLTHLSHIAPTIDAPLRLYQRPDGSLDASVIFMGGIGQYREHITESDLEKALIRDEEWQIILIPSKSLIKRNLTGGVPIT